MYAYVDETGNTGSNIFDIDQPDYFTAALITKTNFDVLNSSRLKKLCSRIEVESLHASVIGIGRVEAVSLDIERILKNSDARFFISRVEKRYLLATKVFDTFFDSGENPAVPWTAYNIRPLRLMLAFKVASLIDDNIAKEFWAMLMAKSEENARNMIPGICNDFLSRVHLLPDARSQQIVRDAFLWSRDHPKGLDIFIAGRQAKNGHMPNMVAFKNLLDGLEGFSKKWKRPVKKITHDRQSQFAGTLAEWHRLTANASPEPIRLPGETHVLRQVHGSEFEVSASSSSAGIQVADLALWLFRQFLKGKDLPENSSRLLSFIMKRAWQTDFSFEGVGRAATERHEEIMESELTPDQMEAAAKMVSKVEDLRRKNIDLYEKDGLMPYQRERVGRIKKDTN